MWGDYTQGGGADNLWDDYYGGDEINPVLPAECKCYTGDHNAVYIQEESYGFPIMSQSMFQSTASIIENMISGPIMGIVDDSFCGFSAGTASTYLISTLWGGGWTIDVMDPYGFSVGETVYFYSYCGCDEIKESVGGNVIHLQRVIASIDEEMQQITLTAAVSYTIGTEALVSNAPKDPDFWTCGCPSEGNVSLGWWGWGNGGAGWHDYGLTGIPCPGECNILDPSGEESNPVGPNSAINTLYTLIQMEASSLYSTQLLTTPMQTGMGMAYPNGGGAILEYGNCMTHSEFETTTYQDLVNDGTLEHCINLTVSIINVYDPTVALIASGNPRRKRKLIW